MRNKAIDDIAREKLVFTIEDAKRIFRTKEASIRVALSRMEQSGWIERLERGKYMIIPLGERKGKYTMNEFVLARMLAPGGAVAYWSALNFHGLTEQIPTTVFVQNTKRKKKSKLELFGLRYRFITVKGNKFFGTENVWIGEEQVTITDPEKTIIDCLDMPHLCGGVIEAAKGVKSRRLDPDRLSEYALRFGSIAVVRRLGFLSEMYGIPLDLHKTDQRSYVYLDPTLEKQGPNSPKWRLKINLDLEELE